MRAIGRSESISEIQQVRYRHRPGPDNGVDYGGRSGHVEHQSPETSSYQQPELLPALDLVSNRSHFLLLFLLCDLQD